MKEKVGEVFSIAKDNEPVTGCTISKEVHGGENSVIYFSLARNTDISAEIFPYHKLLIVADGSLEVYGPDEYSRSLGIGDCVLMPTDSFREGNKTVQDGIAFDTGIIRRDAELQGGSIMKGWMAKENEMICCCSDGTRPVIFKVERIDYED